MKGFINTIRAEDGQEIVREINGLPTLDLLRAAIGGGYIEVVPWFTRFQFNGEIVDCVAFCDKYGKGKMQHFNAAATVLWAQARRCSVLDLKDCLVGDIAIMFGDREFMEEL